MADSSCSVRVDHPTQGANGDRTAAEQDGDVSAKNLWRLRHNTACLYRARNLVERFFNKIKQCRRVATRYDKLAANYLAFIQLASIRLWLRVNESTP